MAKFLLVLQREIWNFLFFPGNMIRQSFTPRNVLVFCSYYIEGGSVHDTLLFSWQFFVAQNIMFQPNHCTCICCSNFVRPSNRDFFSNTIHTTISMKTKGLLIFNSVLYQIKILWNYFRSKCSLCIDKIELYHSLLHAAQAKKRQQQ